MQNKKRIAIISGIVITVTLLLVGITIFILNTKRSTQPSEPTSIVSTIATASAELSVIIGSAKLTHNDTERTISTDIQARVAEGDFIATNTDSVATLDYGEGTVIRLGPDSQMQFTQVETKIHVRDALGKLYIQFKKVIGIHEELEVESFTTLAAVRGTKFAFFSGDITKLVAQEDEIWVKAKDQSGKVVKESHKVILPGFQAEVATDSAQVVVKEKSLTPQETSWLDFNLEADKLIDSQEKDKARVASIAAELVKSLELQPSPSPESSPSSVDGPTPKPQVNNVTQMLGAGYNTGFVETPAGGYILSCFGSSKSSVKVITDSANEEDCKNDCPIKPLHEYAQNSGGFAAINGMYFCPADYASCSDGKNSFDTLFFNSRVKRYINSENNVYSTLPFLVVDNSSNPRFVPQTLEWGRDTNISAGTAGNPMLILGGSISASAQGLDNKQLTVKSTRGAFVHKGDMLYLCIVSNATVLDTAQVYKTLGVDNAINIDGGGSSALWVNGSYKFGPGRQIPTAIIFAPR